jgi:hypothetical protein
MIFELKISKKVAALFKVVRLETAYMLFQGVFKFKPLREYGLVAVFLCKEC